MRQRRLLLPLLALAAVLTAALAMHPGDAAAKSRYKLGMGDQSPFLFDNSNFKSLKIKQVRLIVPWNWNSPDTDTASLDAWLRNARAQKKKILVAFNAYSGCYENGRYSRAKKCRAPSARSYTRKFKAFRKAYPFVKQFQPWNEVNHKSQPTYRKPSLAGRYYVALKQSCRSCTVAAADILDSSNQVRYVKSVKRYIDRRAKGKRRYLRPRIWGYHNYSDVNRHRARQTRAFMRAVPGQVWLTETGGLVRFLPNFKTSNKRAVKSTRYMFRLANAYSKKKRGLRSRITRVYPYAFFGYTVQPGQPNKRPRFDSGLVGPILLDAGFFPTADSGKARPAYKVFKRQARSKSK